MIVGFADLCIQIGKVSAYPGKQLHPELDKIINQNLMRSISIGSNQDKCSEKIGNWSGSEGGGRGVTRKLFS